MKPSLTLKIGTQLTMTPQLQQAIRLLQLSALDLELEIRETIESNPMLELEEEFPDHTESLESAADVAEAEPGELDGVDTIRRNRCAAARGTPGRPDEVRL
jgi:RNA polymerase sigma-54 factor